MPRVRKSTLLRIVRTRLKEAFMTNRFRHSSGLLPPEWETIADEVEHPDHPVKGVLVRNRTTNHFALARQGTVLNVPQGWALNVAKEQHRAAEPTDPIRESCIERAKALQMSSYAIHKATGGAISENHIQNFLDGKTSMGSNLLQHLLKALRLRITRDDLAIKMDLNVFLLLHPEQMSPHFEGRPTDLTWKFWDLPDSIVGPHQVICPCRQGRDVPAVELRYMVMRTDEHVASGLIAQCSNCDMMHYTH